MDNKPTIVLLIGTSGSGKSVLGKFLQGLGVPKLISHTTRNIRVKDGEINGVNYYFITKEEFDKLDKLEQTCYNGNYYGLSRAEVERHNDRVVYAIVDIQGVKSIKEKYGEQNVIVVYIKVTYLKMIYRMLKRGDKLKDIAKRIKTCIVTKEMENYKLADIVIENNDLRQAKFDLWSKVDFIIRFGKDSKYYG